MSETGLMTVERARAFLAQCRDVDEVKELRDKAETIARYQRSRSAAEDSGVSAAVIARRAERRLGELIAELPKAKGGSERGVGRRGKNAVARSDRIPETPTLADQGITKSQSSKWQAIAAVPEKKFEATIAEAIKAKKPPTSAALVRLAPRPDKKRSEMSRAKPFDAEASARKLRSLCADHMFEVPLDANLEPFISMLRGLLSQLEKRHAGKATSNG